MRRIQAVIYVLVIILVAETVAIGYLQSITINLQAKISDLEASYGKPYDKYYVTKYIGNPILKAGGAGAVPNEKVVASPVVIKTEDGIFKMLYNAQDDDVTHLSFAESTDGLHWNKHGRNPVLSPDVAVEGKNAFESFSLIGGPRDPSTGYKYWLYYGVGRKCFLAESTDLVHWTKLGVVCEDPEGSSSYHVFRGAGGNFLMMYERWYGDRWTLAYSVNGKAWTVYGEVRKRAFVSTPYGRSFVTKGTGFMGVGRVFRVGSWLLAFYESMYGMTFDIALSYSKDAINWFDCPINPILSGSEGNMAGFSGWSIVHPYLLYAEGVPPMLFYAEDIHGDIMIAFLDEAILKPELLAHLPREEVLMWGLEVRDVAEHYSGITYFAGEKASFIVVNDLDQPITVQVEGAWEPSFKKPFPIGSPFTVPTNETRYYTVMEAIHWLRVKIVSSHTPRNGAVSIFLNIA